MANATVLTVAELADRWQCSENAIRTKVNSRKLKIIPDAPGQKFLLSYIEQLEALGMDTDPLSPFERRRLEKENQGLRDRVGALEAILKKIRVETAVVIRWTTTKIWRWCVYLTRHLKKDANLSMPW